MSEWASQCCRHVWFVLNVMLCCVVEVKCRHENCAIGDEAKADVTHLISLWERTPKRTPVGHHDL